MSTATVWTPAMDARMIQYRDLEGMTFTQISEALGVSLAATRSRYGRAKEGAGSKPVREVWTLERITQLSDLAKSGLPDSAIAEIMGMSPGAVSHFREKFKIASGKSYASKRPAPDGFAILAPAMTLKECAQHYSVGIQTAQRWYKETNVKSTRRGVESTAKARQQRISNRRAAIFNQPKSAPQAPLDPSLAGQAQRFLQPDGAVFRARTVRADAPRDEWIVFGKRMREGEMMALAEKKGMCRG